MASPAPDDRAPGADPSSELRRSMGQATERINEIIDAAERVATEIRADAETEARNYLAERKREAELLAKDRTQALDQLTKLVADSAERFKHQAEQLLADLDRAIVEARAGVYRNGAAAAVGVERPPEPVEPPREAVERPMDPVQREPLQARPFSIEREPVEPERPAAVASAYPEAPAEAPAPAPVSVPESADETSEALLRATQMAVTGKGRAEIGEVLRADFPGVDSESILDEILG
jgi:hypothetical protein